MGTDNKSFYLNNYNNNNNNNNNNIQICKVPYAKLQRRWTLLEMTDWSNPTPLVTTVHFSVYS